MFSLIIFQNPSKKKHGEGDPFLKFNKQWRAMLLRLTFLAHSASALKKVIFKT
jgi:hypothetical protein